jgi:hypothetical protein
MEETERTEDCQDGSVLSLHFLQIDSAITAAAHEDAA